MNHGVFLKATLEKVGHTDLSRSKVTLRGPVVTSDRDRESFRFHFIGFSPRMRQSANKQEG